MSHIVSDLRDVLVIRWDSGILYITPALTAKRGSRQASSFCVDGMRTKGFVIDEVAELQRRIPLSPQTSPAAGGAGCATIGSKSR